MMMYIDKDDKHTPKGHPQQAGHRSLDPHKPVSILSDVDLLAALQYQIYEPNLASVPRILSNEQYQLIFQLLRACIPSKEACMSIFDKITKARKEVGKIEYAVKPAIWNY